MMGLTRRQADCLAIIRSYIAEHGCSPSYTELMRALGCQSKSTVARLIGGLKARGYVDWTRYGQRTLRLVEPPPPASLHSAPSPSPSRVFPTWATRHEAEHGSTRVRRGGGLGRGQLPPELRNRLAQFCDAHGEAADDVIADAVLLHLDAFDTPPTPHVPLLRCDECDNGIDPGWTYCPFCGSGWSEGDKDAEALAVFGAAFYGAVPRPSAVLQWAVETFGGVARHADERAARFIEEAIELAQTQGLARATIDAILDRVYSRPAGDAAREIGQAQVTLECLAESLGHSADVEADREFSRVRAIPREEWARRHSRKREQGIADLTTVEDGAP